MSYLSTVFCTFDEFAKSIVCEYSKPKLLYHPVWTVNGSTVVNIVTLTTLNATHHIAVLNYTTFQSGSYDVKLEYGRLVGPVKAFCQHVVPSYKATVTIGMA